MKQGSLNFFELHVEKFILGAAGLFTVACIWLYLINSPNRIEYNGQTVGPGELDDKTLEHAQTLKRAVDNAKPAEAEQPKYAEKLKAQHAAGIFGQPAETEGPALARTLTQATGFGARIEISGQKEEQATNIEVVTPLRPSAPVARTGLSMAVRKEVDLAAAAATPRPDESAAEEPDAVETPWVSIAGWFDVAAQQSEMTAARYEPYLTRVLFAGVDVERQEQTSDGSWTEWTLVKDSKAMPKLDAPEPLFDQDAGVIVNKDAIDAAYALVLANQEALAEPKFYTVDAGDDWHMPPLDGLEIAEAEEEEPDEPVVAERPDPKPETRQPPAPRPGREDRGNSGGGISGPNNRGGRTQGTPPPNPGQSEAQQKRENQRVADKALADARKAFAKRDYDTARQQANTAVNTADAKPKTRADAEKLLVEIDKKQVPSDVAISGPGRGIRGTQVDPRGGATTANEPAATLVTHPEKDEQVAVWFHDDSVQSGKTYRYRLRVKLWNRYVGLMKAVKNVDDSKKAMLLGEWSLPSGAITVAPSTHLFVKSPKGNKQAASVDVWKWRAGTWIKETFEVAVGDTIGGVKRVKSTEFDDEGKEKREDVDFSTGAVVLDLRFDERVKVRNAAGKKGEFTYREVTSLVLVYLDPADGQIKERAQALDRDDPIKKRLERDAEGA